MQHIAIDLGASKSQVCIRNARGEILEEKKIGTTKLVGFLKKQPHSRVVLETCAESWEISEQAVMLGHQVRVVPGHLVRSLGVGYRQMKSDKKDAQALSEVSTRIDLPSVHLRSRQSREIQSRLKMREQLVSSRTQLINSVRGWMRTQTIRVKSGATHTFTRRLREKKVDLPVYLHRQLDQIDALTKALESAGAELLLVAQEVEGMGVLRSIPGIGLLTSLCFVSVIDDGKRFTKAHHFQSYIGLTPGERSSGKIQRTTSITKAGSSMLRYLLIQAAWTVYTHRKHEPMALWAKGIEQRRGKKIAVVALARKLAGILFAVWKAQKPYQAQKSAKM